MKSILVLAAFICCVTGLTVLNERIVGDTDADNKATAGQFPYVVSVIDSTGRHICGGFIYNEQWIVTAASCVSGKSTSTIKVIVNQLSLTGLDEGEQTIAVNSISINPEYNATVKRNDIALVKLVETLDFTVGKYIFLKYDELIEPAETGLTVMGWGASVDGGSESLTLRFAKVDAVEVKKETTTPEVSCGTYVTDKDFFIPSMICAIPSATDEMKGSPCSHDEGSPLVLSMPETTDPGTGEIIAATDVAYGIMSKTESCDLMSHSVYTRLSNYYFWFTQIAGPQPSPV